MSVPATPASPTGAGLFLVVNPGAGRTEHRPDPTQILSRELPDADIRVLSRDEGVAEALRARVASSFTPAILGIYGGEGSVAAAAEVAFESRLQLLALPGGTLNHFALTIGISDFATGIAALQRGTGSAVDLAEIDFGNDDRRLALNTMSVGVYPGFVRLRNSIEPVVGRPIAAVAAALRAVLPRRLLRSRSMAGTSAPGQCSSASGTTLPRAAHR